MKNINHELHEGEEEKVVNVLFVEDNIFDYELMVDNLVRANGYTINAHRIENKRQFEHAMDTQEWNFVICDHNLPSYGSEQVLDALEKLGLDIPFVLVSGVMNPDEFPKAYKQKKVDSFLSKEHISGLSFLFKRMLKIYAMHEWTFQLFASGLELRSVETAGHTRRVSDLTVELAKFYGVSASKLVHYRRGAILHDIGKTGISDAVLKKPGALTSEEWIEMKKHPIYAYNLLQEGKEKYEYLEHCIEIPLYHHEKWDGTGYPDGLKGDDIPLSARIFTVVDTWDAITNPRVYRNDVFTPERALQYLIHEKNIFFDPLVVDKFVEMMKGKQNEQQSRWPD